MPDKSVTDAAEQVSSHWNALTTIFGLATAAMAAAAGVVGLQFSTLKNSASMWKELAEARENKIKDLDSESKRQAAVIAAMQADLKAALDENKLVRAELAEMKDRYIRHLEESGTAQRRFLDEMLSEIRDLKNVIENRAGMPVFTRRSDAEGN